MPENNLGTHRNQFSNLISFRLRLMNVKFELNGNAPEEFKLHFVDIMEQILKMSGKRSERELWASTTPVHFGGQFSSVEV